MLKMVVIVNNDIEMSCGKTTVQVAHAAVDCAIRAYTKKRKLVNQWLSQGQKKITLIASIKEILSLEKKAQSMGLISTLIKDAGLTELSPGTLTALAIGPDEEGVIDRITGHLPLK